jgi:hypothetical protein
MTGAWIDFHNPLIEIVLDLVPGIFSWRENIGNQSLRTLSGIMLRIGCNASAD